MRALRFRSAKTGSDVSLAPLLCAGMIGWRSLVIAGEGKKIGLYGFGAAAHIVAQVAKMAGALGVRLHSAGRCVLAGFCPEPRRNWAGGSDESAAGTARCGDHFCDRG